MGAWLRWLVPGLGVTVMAAMAVGLAGPGRAARPVPLLPPEAQERVGGSAFLVAPGLLVTNAHVALRCRAQGRPLEVGGQPGVWQVLTEDPSTDLALLSGPGLDEAPLSLSAAQRLPSGMPVLVLGYPVRDWGSGALQAMPGQIRRAALTVHDPEAGRAVSFVMTDRSGHEIPARWEDGLRYFGADKADRLRWRLEIDAPSSGGSSGGPVLDAAGNVIGVVYAGARGFTSAVPLEDLREFLARAGVAPMFRTAAAAAAPDWRAVQARAARATHRISC
ncbi:serine protease [Roseomonas sp. E05]|uniref:S1 family peptidase n=1 Tax=Roseomonas sp. E05 TaxID=3046310 RepID=UPI0024BB54B1|nr:serine protease [Roseomonas sp. E05]MDJ0390367.1 serine protease [Roseomonas sp. E05]